MDPTFRFSLRPQSGAEASVTPLTPLHSDAAAFGLAPLMETIVPDGSNFLYGETPGTFLRIYLGSQTVTDSSKQAYNGVSAYSDMTVVRTVTIRCPSTAPQVAADWTGNPAGSVTLGWLADCGTPGANQTAAANRVASFTPAATLLVGDFSYNVQAGGAASLNSDVAVFASGITAQKVFPVMGNHEWDRSGILALVAAKFPYVTEFAASKAYYEKLFYGNVGDTDPMLQVLFLDGNFNSAMTSQVGPGLEYGSDQWKWIFDRIRTVKNARYRVACVHWPSTTSVPGSSVIPEVAQLARSGWFDLILVGHAHSYERVEQFGCTVLNISSPTEPIEATGGPLNGAAGTGTLVSYNSTDRCVGKLVATPAALAWEVQSVAGTLIDQGAVSPKAFPFGEMELKLTGFSCLYGSTPLTDVMHFSLRPGSEFTFSVPDGYVLHPAATIEIYAKPQSAADPIAVGSIAATPSLNFCRHWKAQVLVSGS